jgi:hypothetical protein
MGEQQSSALDVWAVVEQLGHNRYAGKISEFVFGGAALIRVDVPEIPERTTEHEVWDDGRYVLKPHIIPATPAFTKFLGPSSIFTITPCTEEVARVVAEQMRTAPIAGVQLPASRPALLAAGDAEPVDSAPGRQF